MTSPRDDFDAFCALLDSGDTLGAIASYYAEDVTVFENRELARAGREACAAYEREQLAAQGAPPAVKIVGRAFDDSSERGFIEMVIRFRGPEGRPMRLEEVAVQQWSAGKIISERFYYEGIVDEGD